MKQLIIKQLDFNGFLHQITDYQLLEKKHALLTKKIDLTY